MDMCLEPYPHPFPHYYHVPALNPYCCRISRVDYAGLSEVISYEDFCAAGNTFQRYLDSCERNFGIVECGEFAEATYYYYDLSTQQYSSAYIYKGMESIKPLNVQSYYFKVSANDDEKEIKVFD